MFEDPGLSVFLLFVALVLLFVFSLLQNYFLLMNQNRLNQMKQLDDEKALRIMNLFSKKDQLFLMFKIGKTLLFLSSSYLVVQVFEPWGLLVLFFIIIIFTEVLPLVVSKVNPTRDILRFSKIAQILYYLLFPLITLLSWIQHGLQLLIKPQVENILAEQELLTIVDRAEISGNLPEAEGELIRRSIEFKDLDAASIITPRVDVVAINQEWEISRIQDLFEETSFSRLPVYEDSIDNIIGVVHVKDFQKLSKDESSIQSIIKPVIYTSLNFPIIKLLRQLQLSKNHFAVVIDEYGGTAGIVTLEDIVEELVGDIYDEHDDVEDEVLTISPTTHRVSGLMYLEDFFEQFHFKTDFLEYETTTVGGWVMDELAHIPEVGEFFTFEDKLITVIDADEKRVLTIQIDQQISIESEEDHESNAPR